MTTKFGVDRKAKALFDAGAVTIHKSGQFATVKSGSQNHIVNILPSDEDCGAVVLRCSCEFQRHQPNREGCAHVAATRLALASQAEVRS